MSESKWTSIIDSYNNTLVRSAIYYKFVKKLKSDHYCDLNDFIGNKEVSKENLKIKLKNVNSSLSNILNFRYPTSLDAFINMTNIDYNDKTTLRIDSDILNLKEEEIVMIIIYVIQSIKNHLKYTEPSYNVKGDIKEEILKYLIRSQLDMQDYYENLNYKYGILYYDNLVDLHFVDSVSSFSNTIKKLKQPSKSNFYRGQSNVNYILQPSIMRDKGFVDNERKMYNELIINSPENFGDQMSHLDILVEMQHYGLPTRLIDITKNPLVALYFSCCEHNESLGEVLIFSHNDSNLCYSKSDRVTILSSLPLFSKKEQDLFFDDAMDLSISDTDFNKKHFRLLHEIRNEKPAFKDVILKKDLLKSLIVLPRKRNKRIVKQDGAFIICKLSKTINDLDLDCLRLKDKGKKKIIIIVRNKSSILSELNSFSINKSTLFPEIDSVAAFLKTEYSTN